MAQLQAAPTNKLGLSLVEVNASAQVQRVNDALASIDILVQGSVEDKDLTTPPTIVNGEAYIVATGATGAWSGKAKQIAAAINSAWVFFVPNKGWTFMVDDESVKYVYDGANWVQETIGATTAPTWTTITKTSNFTVSLSEAAIYLLDATSGNLTATMLAAASMGSRAFIFKRIDSSANTCTIDGNASETIDGQLTIELVSQYDSVTVFSNGTNLYLL